MTKTRRLTVSILLIVLMIICVPLIISGNTYQYGLVLLVLSVLASMTVLLIRQHVAQKKDPLKALTWTALGIWLFIILAFFSVLAGMGLFGEGLYGLSNWAKVSLVLGAGGILLTATQLVRTAR